MSLLVPDVQYIPGKTRIDSFLKYEKDLKNNRLYKLPYELQILIFQFNEDYLANLIIDRWYYYLHKKILLSSEIIQIIEIINDWNTFNIILPVKIENLKILEKCNKILNGRENIWWLSAICYVINGLMYYNEAIKNWDKKYIEIYYECEKIVCQLLTKFKVFPNYQVALNYYYVLYDLDDNILNTINDSRLLPNFDINNI